MKKIFYPSGLMAILMINLLAMQAQDTVRISFTGMDPHVGQSLFLRVVGKSDNSEVGRKSIAVAYPDFSIEVGGIQTGASYNLDFFADLNANGHYDAPPVDHAWRIALNEISGDTTVAFAHNTSFTDIAWQYKLTVNFKGMTLHLDQVMYLYLRNHETDLIFDSLKVDPIVSDTFDVSFFSIEPDGSYHVDFYVDFNENGGYDLPPTDHAWRIHLLHIEGDTILDFAYNTIFTDIELEVTTGVNDLSESGFSVFPNPVSDELIIRTRQQSGKTSRIRIYNTSGMLVMEEVRHFSGQEVRISVSGLKPGLYTMNIIDGANHDKVRFLKE